MLYTTNLNLGKPEASDTVNPNSRSAFNTNADTIDSAIGDLDSLETTEQTSLVGAINELAVDYVVERGTTTTVQSTEAGGGTQTWQYVKWNSGYLEAWTEYIYTGLACNTASGDIYITSDWQENFPTMFTTVTGRQLSKSAGTAAWLMIGTGASNPNHLTPRIYFCRAEAVSSMNAYLCIHYKGTWK